MTKNYVFKIFLQIIISNVMSKRKTNPCGGVDSHISYTSFIHYLNTMCRKVAHYIEYMVYTVQHTYHGGSFYSRKRFCYLEIHILFTALSCKKASDVKPFDSSVFYLVFSVHHMMPHDAYVLELDSLVDRRILENFNSYKVYIYYGSVKSFLFIYCP